MAVFSATETIPWFDSIQGFIFLKKGKRMKKPLSIVKLLFVQSDQFQCCSWSVKLNDDCHRWCCAVP